MIEIRSIIHVVVVGVTFLCSVIVLGVTDSRLKTSNTLFGVVLEGCYLGSGGETRACDLGIAIGAIGLVATIILGVTAVVELLDVKAVDLITNSKIASLIRAIVSGIMAVLFLATFGVVVHDFNDNSAAKMNTHGRKSDGQAAGAFSFFSIVCWVALLVIYTMRFLAGGSSGGGGAASPPVA